MDFDSAKIICYNIFPLIWDERLLDHMIIWLVRNLEIKSLSDFLNLTPADLLKIDNFGKTKLNLFINYLKKQKILEPTYELKGNVYRPFKLFKNKIIQDKVKADKSYFCMIYFEY